MISIFPLNIPFICSNIPATLNIPFICSNIPATPAYRVYAIF
jgi:hypothetical protein